MSEASSDRAIGICVALVFCLFLSTCIYLHTGGTP